MVDTVVVEAETPAVSAVSWPAIITGGFVTAAFTLLLLAPRTMCWPGPSPR
jgi:hypothetical protein